jgi:hypothetical protein
MTITALPAPPTVQTGYRFLDVPGQFMATVWWALTKVPLHGLKVFPPVVLLALSASFASAQFAGHHNVFPFPLNWAQAVAFEWVYIGTLAMVQSKRNVWFYVTLGAGMLTSIIYITLYAASVYGVMGQIRGLTPPEWFPTLQLVVTLGLVIAHGVPLTTVNFVYCLLVHNHVKQTRVAEEAEALLNQHTCPYGCGARFKSEPALRGHKAQCPNKP